MEGRVGEVHGDRDKLVGWSGVEGHRAGWVGWAGDGASCGWAGWAGGDSALDGTGVVGLGWLGRV